MVAARVAQTMTVEEFSAITEDGRFDLVDGEVWHVAASGQRHGKYVVRMAMHLAMYATRTGVGEVYGAGFAYIVDPAAATVLCPDVSVLSVAHVLADNDDFHPGPPDIAVEVISPSETARRVAVKVARYLEAGTAIVWCVYPRTKQIVVHEAESASFILGVGDTLTGGMLLPDFALALATLFGE